MPAEFQHDALRASLPVLAAGQPLPRQAQAYQRFYGLDLPRSGMAFESGLGLYQAAGFDLVAQYWLPPRPRATLVLLHGFYDHMGLYRHVIEWALGRGLAVLSCDLPGHGLSSGARASIADFAHYQATLQGLLAQASRLGLPHPWHVLGQSTGAAIAIDHVLYQADSPLDGETILLAPLVRPRAWGWSQVSYHALRPFVKGIARRFSENSNDPGFLPFLQADPLQPLQLPTAWVGALVKWVRYIEAAPRSARSPLIVQGEQDRTVDWRHNLKVLDGKFAAPRLLRLPQARHHLANELPALRSEYFSFLEQYL
ncbi:alpha/beta hydrolase [Pseudomonas typographi]|uniref:Alpha/beta hydrolase n=1 Tax=Pseudomonas typographi TaxID=2715964 RepID=A0ABR7YZ70_9PSED|nr:alpha/beta hydrolase [Pseudomonas typographi]MBD1549991.1 alpha/beta hydrolase [Pseudomonas typographi]MBD1585373.1 alpha/beta hydrolase [Pseudomonas typographi]MBD1598513.1 alpha/beta hydrolase [Pseudomonas typographi]